MIRIPLGVLIVNSSRQERGIAWKRYIKASRRATASCLQDRYTGLQNGKMHLAKNREVNVKIFQFAFIGLLIQFFGIFAYIIMVRTPWLSFSKPVLIGAIALSLLLLLWSGIRHHTWWMCLFGLPGLLGLGHVGAFYLVGVTGFHDLLDDFELSLDVFLSLLYQGAIIFVAFAAAAVVMVSLHRGTREVMAALQRWLGKRYE